MKKIFTYTICMLLLVAQQGYAQLKPRVYHDGAQQLNGIAAAPVKPARTGQAY